MESNKRLFDELEKIESVFKARPIKSGENEKWVITCGNQIAIPYEFEEQGQAEAFIDQYLPKGYICMAVSTLIITIIEKWKEYKKTQTKKTNKK